MRFSKKGLFTCFEKFLATRWERGTEARQSGKMRTESWCSNFPRLKSGASPHCSQASGMHFSNYLWTVQKNYFSRLKSGHCHHSLAKVMPCSNYPWKFQENHFSKLKSGHCHSVFSLASARYALLKLPLDSPGRSGPGMELLWAEKWSLSHCSLVHVCIAHTTPEKSRKIRTRHGTFVS